MAKLSNINGKFAVEDTGAIRFSDQTGTTGQILKSNGNSAPTWVDPNTVGTGPWLPLAGGIVSGATTFQSSLTVGGTLTVNGSGGSVFNSTATTNHIIAAYRASNGNNVATFRTTDSGYIFRIHAQNAGTIYVQNDDGSNYIKIPDSGSNEVSGNTTFAGNVTLSQPTNGAEAKLTLTSKSAAGNSRTGIIEYDADVEKIFFINEGSTVAAMTSDAKVGIGTDSPTSKLHVDSGAAHGEIRLTTSTAAGYDATLSLIAGTSGGISILNLGYNGDDDYSRIFRTGSGDLRFDTNNAEKMRITSGARINMDVMAGQASEGIIRIGRYDVNTSRYNEIQNSVTSNGAGSYMNLCVHSGTENVVTDVMTLLGNGNVGIGTDSPTSIASGYTSVTTNGTNGGGLVMQVNGTATGYVYAESGALVFTNTSGVMQFYNAGSERLTIDSSGKVSVGICTGNLKEFNVKNQGSNGGLRIEHSGSANTVAFLGQGGSGDEGVLFLQDSGVDTVKIAGENGLDSFINSGNVGIGVTDPVTKLDVRGGTGGGSFDHATFTSVTSRGLKISTANSSEGQNGAAVIYNAQDGENYGSHAFQIGGSTKMFIKGNNVGIGTTSPNNKLEISDTGVGTGSTHLKISRGANATAVQRIAGIKMGNTASNDGSNWIIQADSSLGYFDSANLDFIHNAAGTANTKMRITSGGNVAIGGTLGADSQFRVEFKPAGTILAGLRIGYNSTSNNYFDGDNQYFRDGAGSINRMIITSGGTTEFKRNVDILSDQNTNMFKVRSTSGSFTSSVLLVDCDRTTTNNTYNLAAFTNAGTAKCVITDGGDLKNTNNSYGAISDERLKENITDATPKLDDLMKVKVRNFNMIGDDKKQIGVVAQELEEVFPNMIDESINYEYKNIEDEDGNITEENIDLGTTTKSVKYSVFVPMLIKAIQELEARIKILENK